MIAIHQAQALLQRQFPQWAGQELQSVNSGGTSNTLFRLGSTKVLRFPRSENAAQAVSKEFQWLPQLSKQLSLHIPVPIALGEAQEDYPWPWSVGEWFTGQDLWQAPITDLKLLAQDLAQFVWEMRSFERPDGPRPGAHNSYRGVPLKERDAPVQAALRELGDSIDAPAAQKAWARALEAERWPQDCWIHGDLIPGNLLAQNHRLKAVIDFGLLAVGDPAVDLIPAWNLLDRSARAIFSDSLEVDEASWLRGQGWALYQALLALPYYWDSNPYMVQLARQVLNAQGIWHTHA